MIKLSADLKSEQDKLFEEGFSIFAEKQMSSKEMIKAVKQYVFEHSSPELKKHILKIDELKKTCRI